MFVPLLLAAVAAAPAEIAIIETATGCTPVGCEVVVFLAAECPLARLYVARLNELATKYPQFRFRGISTNRNTPAEAVRELERQLGFPYKADEKAIELLGATRSPEVFLLIEERVVYQGRIDDQYSPGTNRSQPTRHDLEEALREVIAIQPVRVPRTTATGCRITRRGPTKSDVTFAEVAPILLEKCGTCHRPGEVGPFPLLTYEDAASWQAMIGEVVENGRMPPWHADPRYGHFANDRSLTPKEKTTLLNWIVAGAPRGESMIDRDSSAEGLQTTSTATSSRAWEIRPDRVLEVVEPFAVPAHGQLDYQEFVLDPQLSDDAWIQAVEIRPGNAAVVHHINVFVRPRDARPGYYYTNEMADGYLAMTVPGNAVTRWPAGIAKVLPADSQIVLSVHYQPNGTPQTDQSRIAVEFADPRTVRQQIATRVFLKDDLVVPPQSIVTARQEWRLENDYTLYALYPHMHLRGRSVRFETDDRVLPANNRVLLLRVPAFDFNWQHRYVLAEPIHLKAGTVIRCTAVFDNTAANPNNPNPAAEVHHGPQSTDEMFQCCFEVVLTHENRQAPRPVSCWSVVATSCLALVLRKKKQDAVPAT